MTEQLTNPLIAARSTTAVGRMERGTDLALSQLQAHCDQLNRMNIPWRWDVRGTAPNRYVHRAA